MPILTSRRWLLAASVLPLVVLAACTSTSGQPGSGTGTTATAAGPGATAPGSHRGLSAVRHVWGQLIDRASADLTDPAELFAVGMRTSGRLGWTHPDIAGFLTGMGLDALGIPGGLAPSAVRDIEAGQAAGRFTVPDAEIALSTVAGGLLGLLRMCQYHPDRIQQASAGQLAQQASAGQLAREASAGQLAEAVLRLLGVPAPEAARLTALPLPPTDTW